MLCSEENIFDKIQQKNIAGILLVLRILAMIFLSKLSDLFLSNFHREFAIGEKPIVPIRCLFRVPARADLEVFGSQKAEEKGYNRNCRRL